MIAADLLVLAVVALITVPVLVSGHRIGRVEGGAFVAAYVGYPVWLAVFSSATAGSRRRTGIGVNGRRPARGAGVRRARSER